MSSKSKKTIVIFQYDFPIHIHTINLLTRLCEEDFNVKLFIGGVADTTLVNFEELYKYKNINVYDYSKKGISRFLYKIKRRIAKYVSSTFYFDTIETDTFNKSLNILKNDKELILIGIEKQGLIWAGKIHDNIESHLIYYSLELYLEDHPGFKNDYLFNELRKKEIYYHRKCIATIIQDNDRKNVLYSANKVNCDSIFIPVSLRGGVLNTKDYFLHAKLQLSKDTNVILYYGMISKTRFGQDFIDAIYHLDKKYTIVLHGFGDKNYIQELKSINLDNLIISEEMLSETELIKFVNSARIGLALYNDCCENDRLTAYSSAKIAQYCQCGIPFISLNIGNYKAMQDQFHCCELMDNYSDLNIAVQTIEQNYESYQNNSYKSFLVNYDFEKLSKKLINLLKEIDL